MPKPDVVDIEQYVVLTAREYGINEHEFLQTLKCESGLETEIQSRNRYKKDYPKWGVKEGERELSFGIAQIHLPDHPDVTKSMANNPKFAVHWAANKFKDNPKIWTCYRTHFT